MKVSKVLVSIVLLFSLTLASCAAPVAQTQAPVMETSMSTETQEAPAASTETLVATDDSASMSEGVEVEIEDFAYLSAAITIKVGTTVTWTNKDSVRHTVSSDTGLFESGLFGKGESFSHTFTEVGTFTYHCAPHPYMKGTVIVE